MSIMFEFCVLVNLRKLLGVKKVQKLMLHKYFHNYGTFKNVENTIEIDIFVYCFFSSCLIFSSNFAWERVVKITSHKIIFSLCFCIIKMISNFKQNKCLVPMRLQPPRVCTEYEFKQFLLLFKIIRMYASWKDAQLI